MDGVIRNMLGEVVLTRVRGSECDWMAGRPARVPMVDGTVFPRARGFICGPVDVLSAPGLWCDSLAPHPTRAEQKRQDNAILREAIMREAVHFGLPPERLVEMLRAGNTGAEYVAAWEGL